MKKHNGMRPQDVVVLLKIIALSDKDWRNVDIAQAVKISPSEVSEALNRCVIAKLVNTKKRNVNRNALSEFLIHGIKYVFPVEPGAIVKGVATAHSATPVKEHFGETADVYVWPYVKGKQRGQAIEPLYKTIPFSVKDDPLFYELLAIVDTIRIGRAREVEIAVKELKKRLDVR